MTPEGSGASTADDVTSSHWSDLIAVMNAREIEMAALVGNSLGGLTALDAATQAPERVVGVVGVASGLSDFTRETTEQTKALEKEQARLEGADPRDPGALAEFDIRLWVDGPGQSPARVPAAIRQAVLGTATRLHAASRVDGHGAVAKLSTCELLADLTCPVLAIAGELDLADVVETARYLEANAPNARAMIWPDVAHMTGMEVPDRLVTAIVDFLAPLDRWS